MKAFEVKVNLVVEPFPLKDENNIKLEVYKKGNMEYINLKVNKRKIFETLANKDKIVGAVNSKLNELIQQHLEMMEKAEKQRNEGIIWKF